MYISRKIFEQKKSPMNINSFKGFENILYVHFCDTF